MVTSARFHRIVPAGLRLSALALRFLLIFFLARFISVQEVGLYSLLLATVSFVVFVLGFDFYTYSTRQMIRDDGSRWRTFARSQVAFATILYVVVCPFLVLLFTTGLLPWRLAIWFLLLLPLEHLGLEVDRLLIALQDQLGASLGLFVRQGMAPLIAIPLMMVSSAFRTLETALLWWVLMDAVGVAIGLLFLRRHWRRKDVGRVDWGWIRRGVSIAFPFLVGTLCLRGLFTFDRQIVSLAGDLTILGAYGLFMTIGAGMTQVLAAGVQQFLYPRLVRTAHEHDASAFRHTMRTLAIQTTAGALLITAVVLVAEPLILRFANGQAYTQYAWVLPWAMLVNFVYNLSLVPHYGLYALDADRPILYITVIAFAVFAVTVWGLLHIGVVIAVLAGVGAACTVLLVSKGMMYYRVRARTGF